MHVVVVKLIILKKNERRENKARNEGMLDNAFQTSVCNTLTVKEMRRIVYIKYSSLGVITIEKEYFK